MRTENKFRTIDRDPRCHHFDGSLCASRSLDPTFNMVVQHLCLNLNELKGTEQKFRFRGISASGSVVILLAHNGA